MHCLQFLIPLAALVATALGNTCNHDNCYRAVIRYERETAPSFCSKFLATAYVNCPLLPTLSENPSLTINSTPKPHALGCSPKVNPPLNKLHNKNNDLTYPQRISSACSCLTTTTTSTPTPTSTLSTSTCERSSAAACPTPYTPCCAYLCAEAQVPFLVCSQENETVLAQCQKCPSPTKTPSTTPTKTPTTTPTTSPSKTTSTSTSTTASTCERSSASACPTPKSKCCNYLCSVAQVPFEICSETDTSGQFEVCKKCGA